MENNIEFQNKWYRDLKSSKWLNYSRSVRISKIQQWYLTKIPKKAYIEELIKILEVAVH